MCYRHPTRSYMFGGGIYSPYSYYDKELFEEYFEELKKYDYSYIDEINHSIYFTVDKGFELYKNYPDICKKYQEKFDTRLKKSLVDKKKKELEEMVKTLGD